jgi:hypothetical protein
MCVWWKASRIWGYWELVLVDFEGSERSMESGEGNKGRDEYDV